MPLKSYLKLYLVFLGAALAVAVVCFALVQGLNSVRERAYLESLPEALLSWVSDHPQAAHSLMGNGLPGDWAVVPVGSIALDSVAQERLAYGQVLALRQGDGVVWLFQLEDDAVLRLSVREPYRDLAEIQAAVLASLIEQRQLAFSKSALLFAGGRLGVLAEPLTDLREVPDPVIWERLSQDKFAFFQQESSDAARVFVRLGEHAGENARHAGQIFKMTMPAPFNPWGWPILALVVIVVAATIALLVYLLLSQLHQHLRNIENVVTRIARGELEARVRSGKLSLVGRLGEAFNRMADHIQRLVGVQREMIHAVSHELRTPVARIRFGVQMLEDCDSAASRNQQLAGIDADIQELDELIDEILTYARLEQGGPILSFQDVDVAQVVNQVIGEQRQTRQELVIESEFLGDADRWSLSHAEPRYLHRAIQNLVGNATRYAQQRVVVRCHFDAVTCRVDVEDDGAGIPEEDWDKVFTAFARLDDSRTRKSGGYGLGLSIVRRILYWHGGQAFVGRSEALGGARFSLVWPRRQL